MRAFIDTEVSKSKLLANLHEHQKADNITKDYYWFDGSGCAIGCTLHDYRPGEEDDHRLYEPL